MATSDAIIPDVWIVSQMTEEESQMIEAHVSRASAEEAVREYEASGAFESGFEVQRLELKSVTVPEKPKDKANSRDRACKRKKDASSSPNADGDDEVESSPVPKRTKATAEERNSLPEIKGARDNSLRGLNIFFTGTLTLNRKTWQATAMVYGATIAASIDAADYVLLGAKPGPKKAEDLKKNPSKIINEEQFKNMVRGLDPDHRHDSIAADSDADADSEIEMPPPPKVVIKR